MSRLEKCPLCGKPVYLLDKVADEEFNGKVWCTNWKCELCKAPFTPANWNRLARLVRKGRMFEWLEKQRDSLSVSTIRWGITKARDWWRKRKGGG